MEAVDIVLIGLTFRLGLQYASNLSQLAASICLRTWQNVWSMQVERKIRTESTLVWRPPFDPRLVH